MKIESSAFKEGQAIPSHYTCDGEDKIPPLAFADISPEAKSLALIMDDPDVPTSVRPDGMWNHWLAWNIPPETTQITEGEEPSGVIGNNTGEKPGYMGPCPPDKEHRYFFKLYALDTMLDLDQGASKQELEKTMEGHILAQAQLMGRYNRPQNQ